MDRVVVYIDGFNLYFGIIERGWRRYLWLDLDALAHRLLQPKQSLIATKYFTARVRDDKGKIHRQSTFLQALKARGQVNLFYGRYQRKLKQCRHCNAKWNEYEEKMTDVRLATELMRDAYKDIFDVALIITADGDLEPPITTIKKDFPGKKIVLVFPPKRDNPHLRAIADDCFRIGRGSLSKCQLPPLVTKPDGFKLIKPRDWN